MGRLIILSGPSCVGKGPLHAAFKKFYPDLASRLQKLVLYNCRSPRPGEIDGKDYYFRSREEIKGFLEKDNFIVLDIRGDLLVRSFHKLPPFITGEERADDASRCGQSGRRCVQNLSARC